MRNTGLEEAPAGIKIAGRNINNLRDAEHVNYTPGLGRSPGEGNGTHSSILAWEIPWTEAPDGLQSLGSQRVRHD